MAKPKFNVRKIKRTLNVKHARKLFGGLAGLLLTVFLVLAFNQAFAANAVQPSTSPSQTLLQPTVSNVNLSNTPTTAPTGANAVLPQFEGANIKGVIVNQTAADTTAEQNPVQLYDALNVWGRLNVLNGIWNTRPDVLQSSLKVGTSLSAYGHTVNLTGTSSSAVTLNVDSTASATISLNSQRGPLNTLYIHLYGLAGGGTGAATAGLYISQSSINPIPPFPSAVTINDNLDVQGAVKATGSLRTDGTIISNGLTSYGTVDAGGLTIDTSGNLSSSGNITAGDISGTNLRGISGLKIGSVGNDKLTVYSNGNLSSSGAISALETIAAGTGVSSYGNAAVVGDVTAGGSVTGSSVGSFYTKSCSTATTSTTITNTTEIPVDSCRIKTIAGYKEIFASCKSGDVRIACSGFQYNNHSYNVFKGTVPVNIAGGASLGCQADSSVVTANTYALDVYAFCFSPDG